MNLITLSRTSDCWLATWSGPHAAKIHAAFGTTTLPTAFTPRADAVAVRDVIAKLNPAALVQVRN